MVYKVLKGVLRNKMAQWLYRRIHPDTGVRLAEWFSRRGPKHTDNKEEQFHGPEKEFLVQYCLQTLQEKHIDYFVFGHRHLALEYPLPQESLYINLGDWIKYDSYAEFDGKDLKLKYYKTK